MSEEKNQPLLVEIEDCEEVLYHGNVSKGYDVRHFKAKNVKGLSVRDNGFLSESPDNTQIVEIRQQLAELRQKVDGIKEEGTRSQAVVIIEEMEEAATVDLRKIPQLYQKCFGLLKDYAELFTILAALGASLGL